MSPAGQRIYISSPKRDWHELSQADLVEHLLDSKFAINEAFAGTPQKYPATLKLDAMALLEISRRIDSGKWEGVVV